MGTDNLWSMACSRNMIVVAQTHCKPHITLETDLGM